MVPTELTPADCPPTALITGAARRIGAAFSRALAEDGWNIVLHCNSSRHEADLLAAELAKIYPQQNFTVAQKDLVDPDVGETLLAQCPSPPTLLVNNASIFEEDQLDNFDVALWDRQMAINLRAPALLTRAFAARLPADAGGLVVNLLDAKLSAPNADFFSYTISKMGLAGLVELSARALAPRIRVNAIAPSITLVSGPQSRKNFETVRLINALQRGVDVDDLVAALRYLVQTPTVTGQTLTIDAGQRLLALTRDVAYMAES